MDREQLEILLSIYIDAEAWEEVSETQYKLESMPPSPPKVVEKKPWEVWRDPWFVWLFWNWLVDQMRNDVKLLNILVNEYERRKGNA